MALGNNLKKPGKSSGKKGNLPQPKPALTVEEEEQDIREEPEEIESQREIDLSYHDDYTEEETGRKEVLSLFCVFKAGNEEYGIPISKAKEVIKAGTLAPIPQSAPYISGMANVRGTIYAVLDIDHFFTGKSSDAAKPFLLVVNDDTHKVAIQIPNVPDTLAVPESAVETITSSMLRTVKYRAFLRGVIKKDRRMIVLLNILEMISADGFAVGRITN